jgi:hypothetical protein
MTRPFGWTLALAVAASLSLSACGGQNYEKADSKQEEVKSPAAHEASPSDQHAHDQPAQTVGEAKDGELLAGGCTCSTDKAGCRCGHCVGAVDECHCKH